jgi:hypothetical protein
VRPAIYFKIIRLARVRFEFQTPVLDCSLSTVPTLLAYRVWITYFKQFLASERIDGSVMWLARGWTTGFVSRQSHSFLSSVQHTQTSSGDSFPFNGYRGIIIREKSGRIVKLVIHFHLLPTSGIRGALPPCLPIHLHGMMLTHSYNFTCHFTCDVHKIVLLITNQTGVQKYYLLMYLTITCQLLMLYRVPWHVKGWVCI